MTQDSARALVQATLLGEALESAPTAAFVSDEDGKYVAVNPAACKLLGYERDELLRLRVADVSLRGARQLGKLTRELLERGAMRGESRLRHKDGSSVRVGYLGVVTRIGGVEFLLTICDPDGVPGVDSGRGTRRRSV